MYSIHYAGAADWASSNKHVKSQRHSQEQTGYKKSAKVNITGSIRLLIVCWRSFLQCETDRDLHTEWCFSSLNSTEIGNTAKNVARIRILNIFKILAAWFLRTNFTKEETGRSFCSSLDLDMKQVRERLDNENFEPSRFHWSAKDRIHMLRKILGQWFQMSN